MQTTQATLGCTQLLLLLLVLFFDRVILRSIKIKVKINFESKLTLFLILEFALYLPL